MFVVFLFWSSLAWGTGETNEPPRKHRSGFTYLHETVREAPWSIHVLKVDRGHPSLEFQTTLGKGATFGMATVSEQVKAIPSERGRAVAAINGDFYHNTRTYPGDPDGLQIVAGELVSAPSATRVCFWIDPAGHPQRSSVVSRFQVTWADHTTTPFGLNEQRSSDEAVLYTAVIGPSTRTSGGVELVLERAGDRAWLPLRVGQTYAARVREVRSGGDASVTRDGMVLSIGPKLAARLPRVEENAVLQISTATVPDLGGAKTAIGGGPTLVEGGKANQWKGLQPRHPRTAVGWNKDFIFLVEVDGRQSKLSVGMTLPELAAYMIKLGCEEALNFDGGGSATFWVLGNVVNSPSEGRERPAANALVLVQKERPPQLPAQPSAAQND